MAANSEETKDIYSAVYFVVSLGVRDENSRSAFFASCLPSTYLGVFWYVLLRGHRSAGMGRIVVMLLV